MADVIQGNAIIGQGGGPTAVINQSVIGALETLRGAEGVGTIFGARHGVRGIVNDDLVDLGDVPVERLERCAATPSAFLGSTRDKPDKAYCEKIFDVCRRRDIRYFFYIGGNDSSDTCRIVNQLSSEAGYELRCFHIPKTIDNDLVENDHTPGFPSAARFVAMAFIGDNLDNASLPGIKVNVVMGRHAGFLTASAALARTRDDDGPHLIYLPEKAFDLDAFSNDVEQVYKRLGRCQIAVSEGIHDAEGQLISAKMSTLKETDAHGNVQLSGTGALGDYLAHHLRTSLAPKGGKPPRVRADTFGYLQRCWPDPSPVDQREARAAGKKAAEIALSGDRDGSIAIQRVKSEPYESRMNVVPLAAVAGKTRHMPPEYIKGTNDVAPSFLDYVRPLVGDLPVCERL